MIDTHVHLCDKRFDKDREPVIQRAFEAGVTHLIEIAYAPQIVPRAHDLAREHPNLFIAVGVHPHEAGRVPESYLPELREHARHPRIMAIGETGLDFYRNRASREDQERWFRAQLALCDELGLPVVIHQREALEDTFRILEDVKPEAGGVLHCFSNGPREIDRAHAIGFKIGLGGVLTYGSADVEAAVRHAPADMLMLETDAPYLEPEPRSLRRNEPALLGRVVKKLCELRDWTPAEARETTTANAKDLFRLPIGAGPATSGTA